MRSQYWEAAKSITLPQFLYKIPGSLVLGSDATKILLDRVHLLSGFHLADKNVQIDFSMPESRVYTIDIDESDGASEEEPGKSTRLSSPMPKSVSVNPWPRGKFF